MTPGVRFAAISLLAICVAFAAGAQSDQAPVPPVDPPAPSAEPPPALPAEPDNTLPPGEPPPGEEKPEAEPTSSDDSPLTDDTAPLPAPDTGAPVASTQSPTEEPGLELQPVVPPFAPELRGEEVLGTAPEEWDDRREPGFVWLNPPRERARKEDRNAGDPCRIANTVKDAWIDRLQARVHATVCNSAVWFDHFFGQGEAVDSEDFYGFVGLGLLYKTSGEWDDQSRFDANIPLPNLNKRLNLFVGRGDEEQIVSDQGSSVAEPVAPFDQLAGESWLAGFGYSPPGKRGQRLNFRLGAKVSSDPYVFAQARWRYNRFFANDTALRLRETVFYRTNDDGFGSTTSLAFDWVPHQNFLARGSASATISQDDRGVDWKSFLTLYQDLSDRWGKARGAAYQYFIRGYTEERVTVPEFGIRVTYRQQMFRPYLFGEVIGGYSWDRFDDENLPVPPERDGSWNLGFVIELQFGLRERGD